ncbi:mannitol dehydrogenase C-terminal domain-containing protein [Peziza echinospora]|nr:mannitol dehydrogenase C-terminal domain-containing protein [Peziza echinospora]
MSTPRAVHFGAGSIGRGFIGALLLQSGYHVTFTDINKGLIDAINDNGGYQVHILLPDGSEQLQPSKRNLSACLANGDQVVDEIARADIITTAVGADVLKHIAPVIAKGLSERRRRREKTGGGGGENVGGEYLNIIACENRVGATSLLKSYVEDALTDPKDKEYLSTYIGFANCSVDRIVPPCPTDTDGISPRHRPTLDVRVELFQEWIVDKLALKGKPPFPVEVQGMELTDHLPAFEERKLFTLNTGHAMTAYLGYLKGYSKIHQAINDDEICRNVRQAMLESGSALCKRHGFDQTAHSQYIDRIITRFKNPHLRDDCTRVARDPLRKLGKTDRFIGPANICREYGFPNKHLCRAIAATLRFDNEHDEQSQQLVEMVAAKGITTTVEELTGWKRGEKEVNDVVWNYKDLENMKVTQEVKLG